MNYWVLKGNPNNYDWDKDLRPAHVEPWGSRYRAELAPGDRAFLWESGGKSRIIGLGEVVSVHTQRDGDGQWCFDVRYLTKRFAWMPGIQELRKISDVQSADFMLPGFYRTAYALTWKQATALYRTVVGGNPCIRVWPGMNITSATKRAKDVASEFEGFQAWMAADGYAPQSIREYPYFLRRYSTAFHQNVSAATVSCEDDVKRVLDEFDRAFTGGHLGHGEFVERDRGNLSAALRAYVRFVQCTTESTGSACDLPRGDFTPRIRKSVTRLVRSTKVVRAIKALYGNQCQICGGRLELAPGIYYSEGHHLKPLGRPHNGKDRTNNVVCVCPNCHVRLDYCTIHVDPKEFKVLRHELASSSINYHNAQCDGISES